MVYQTCVVIWVLLFLYKTSLVDDLSDHNTTQPITQPNHSPNSPAKEQPSQPAASSLKDDTALKKLQRKSEAKMENLVEGGHKWIQNLMSHEEKPAWSKLSYNHWPTLLGYYNISLEGRWV